MPTKSERTTAFIIKTVAPIFNRQGYVGTSMSDLTKATGLTKGAIYGNFTNKEELALAAFDYNKKALTQALEAQLQRPGSTLDKLQALTQFYRNYHVFTEALGGCPITNVGIDACGINPKLAEACQTAVKEIEQLLGDVMEEGAAKGEIRLPVSALQFAKQLFTMLQGAVSMATITQDRKYLGNTVSYLDQLILRELKR